MSLKHKLCDAVIVTQARKVTYSQGENMACIAMLVRGQFTDTLCPSPACILVFISHQEAVLCGKAKGRL